MVCGETGCTGKQQRVAGSNNVSGGAGGQPTDQEGSQRIRRATNCSQRQPIGRGCAVWQLACVAEVCIGGSAADRDGWHTARLGGDPTLPLPPCLTALVPPPLPPCPHLDVVQGGGPQGGVPHVVQPHQQLRPGEGGGEGTGCVGAWARAASCASPSALAVARALRQGPEGLSCSTRGALWQACERGSAPELYRGQAR